MKYLVYRFEEQEAPGARSFFTEIIASISDIKFAKDGRYILSRDYMTLKVCFSCSCWHKIFVLLYLQRCLECYIQAYNRKLFKALPRQFFATPFDL